MTYIFKRAIEFFEWAPSAGLLLIATTVLAVLANNSFLAPAYGAFLSTPVAVTIGALSIDKPLVLWINDGLMAVFFFLIGLEIKREVLQGQLSSLEKMSLPFIAAIGGMALPALVFLLINQNAGANLNGWAIPAATDIAFALGILALMGTRAPVALKVLLLAIAIIDDLGAIVIIALFYTENLTVEALGLAVIGLAGLVALNRAGVKRIAPYVLIGVFMWVCVLKSGVHATLAGVITALLIPIHGSEEDQRSPLKRLEHGLHPWVAFAIVPLFAFANAGVSFAGMSLSALLSPLTLGIAAGLFIGKQLGVFGFTFIAVKSGLAKLPDGVNWLQIYSLACLTGIGFTMSLFIGTLAFSDASMMNEVRLGVLVGSTLSALLGVALLFASAPKTRQSVQPAT
ncbi:MAG: Na+/H+ antiporter NhaA [Ponticaulis sp.]|nr:Na+/H+ antiporter NhaA [Ponticaulis sp.]|tara:strand:+ start:34998 stop:36194 length:1197 start_codon:yes stop_codon:yes gene_type:complete